MRDIIVIIYMALIIPQRYCIEPPSTKEVMRFPPEMNVVTFVIKSADSLSVSAVATSATIGGKL